MRALTAGVLFLAISDEAAFAAPTLGATSRYSCDDSLKTSFRPDALTKVTLVKFFKKGDELTLGKPTGKRAPNDLCMVKFVIGPGNPGPAGAPSTSAGIGVEAWLPSPANWTGRLHLIGGGGFSGFPGISSLTEIGAQEALTAAAEEASVSATTDTGHSAAITDGSFLFDPDGTLSEAQWRDFSHRAVHEMTVKVKALAAGFYAKPITFSYFSGGSGGGRQGIQEAQIYPEDFDGILSIMPAINSSQRILNIMYPFLVMERDLGGPMTNEQLDLASAAAVSACDASVNGRHDGWITDLAACKYDPARDKSVLCVADGGDNRTNACLTKAMARAVNKMWYGVTADGSAPDPAIDNGYHPSLSHGRLAFGFPRGVLLSDTSDPSPHVRPILNEFPPAQLAANMQNPRLAAPSLKNASGNGEDGWKKLSYAEFARALSEGKRLQPAFANVDADNPDLSRFRDHGGKLIHYHGNADQVIPITFSEHYYVRVAEKMGGAPKVQQFYRYYEVPGMGHGFARAGGGAGIATNTNGLPGISPPADPPRLGNNQMFLALVDWVEKGIAPDSIKMTNNSGTQTRPLCMYPAKLVYKGGDAASAASYSCR